MNQILVQNIETFATLNTFADLDAFDAWMETAPYGIVSLDQDADGEYAWVALVAPEDGPDFIMDIDTGEMEPVEDIDPQAELTAKMDIMMELDNDDEEIFAAITVQDSMNDASQEEILAVINNPRTDENGLVIGSPEQKEAVAKELHDRMLAEGKAILEEWMAEDETPAPAKPRKNRKTSKKVNKAKTNKGAKMRNFEILAAFITNNPGVSRTDVFQDPGLLTSLRTTPQIQGIANGDKAEVKRWNRRLNFLIREMRRQGVDIQIERKGRIAHYTIGKPSGQLELPFDAAAKARNATIIGDDATDVVIDKPAVDPKRATEAPDQSLDFEALLATLDEEAVAPVTK